MVGRPRHLSFFMSKSGNEVLLEGWQASEPFQVLGLQEK